MGSRAAWKAVNNNATGKTIGNQTLQAKVAEG